jgi:cell wall-associated NlpC family hydrolase
MLNRLDNFLQSIEGKKKTTRKRKSTAKKTTTKRKRTLGGTATAKRKTPARKRTTSASNKGAAKLKAITAKAKQIRKAHPGKKWTTCISEASKQV